MRTASSSAPSFWTELLVLVAQKYGELKDRRPVIQETICVPKNRNLGQRFPARNAAGLFDWCTSKYIFYLLLQLRGNL